MANTKKSDFVILGLLSHEALTGYEIKSRVNSSLQMFWGASFGSIYPTLSSLEKEGFITGENTSKNGREKISYTITNAGRRYLKEWLILPVQKDEIRFETLLKLFFGSENGADGTLKHIEAFELKIFEGLKTLKIAESVLERIKSTEEAHIYYLLTVKFGIQTYEAYIRWCKEAKNQLKKIKK